VRLRERCKRHEADEAAIDLLGKIFANEVSLARDVDSSPHGQGFGIKMERVYTVSIESINEGGGIPRHICQLCDSDQTWKHPEKDILILLVLLGLASSGTFSIVNEH
jgi:hypothetical protein